MSNPDAIKEKLQTVLLAQGHIQQDMVWMLQTGGRTNLVWRLSGAQDLICKLYLDASDNPLYANTPEVEYECLMYLDGTGVAPTGQAFLHTEFGSVLLYHFVDGPIWSTDGRAVARLLNRIHEIPAPKNLRVLPDAPDTVVAQGLDMLETVWGDECDALRGLMPSCAQAAPAEQVLLHTDVVPGNLVVGSNGLCLIDWQCPASGDALVDVAMFLSPAMHLVYANQPISDQVRAEFLGALPVETQTRYAQIGVAYHWRMAAYCLWKSHKGHAEYLDAAKAEIKFLQD